VWNPDIPNPIDFFSTWQKLPEQRTYDNAFKTQWELFLRHVALDEPFGWDLLSGAKGVQLAEAALESSRSRRWVDIPDLGEA
jgi:predicted dehydrogenase